MKMAPMEDILEQAIQDGMTTLKQDGIQKILKGECDYKQVSAVCVVWIFNEGLLRPFCIFHPE